MKEWKVNGGLGIISGSLSVDGPIKKDTHLCIIISAKNMD